MSVINNTPKVSVLIPAYNYAHYLDEAIQSVLQQTFTDFELIIVDNQSTDNTTEVVEKYLTDSRVTYVKNPVNLGLVGNLNKCLELARGEYIKFLMADDKFHPQLLEKFVTVLDTHPTVVLVTSHRTTIGLKTKVITSRFNGLQKGEDVIFACLHNGNGNLIGEPTTTMFRKSGLSVGKFNPEYTCLSDLDMWLRLLTAGDCYFVEESLSYFRLHEGQSSNAKDYRNKFDEYLFYKNALRKNPYKTDLSKLNLKTVLREKGLNCAKVMYRTLPGIYKKTNRRMFAAASSIAYAEHVILKALVEVL